MAVDLFATKSMIHRVGAKLNASLDNKMQHARA
jgi:hypothetical protein